MTHQIYSYISFLWKKPTKLPERVLYIRQMRKVTYIKAGRRGCSTILPQPPPLLQRPWIRRELKLRASLWGVKSLNLTSSTPTFKSCTWETSPPKHLAVETNRACVHNTTRIQQSEKWFLQGSHGLICPRDTADWEVPRFPVNGAYLLIWKHWPKRQASNLTHIWELAGVLVRDGGRWMLSLHSPSALLQLVGVSRKKAWTLF